MIRKKHTTEIPKEQITKPGAKIELGQLAMLIILLLLSVMAFANGYYMGKSRIQGQVNVSGNPNTQVNNPPVLQPAQQPVQPQIALETIKALFDKNVIKFGKGDKKLLMVEVADPSCPYCHVAAGVNTEIGSQMGPQFKLVSQGGTYIPPLLEMKKLVDDGKADLVWIYTNGHGNGELATKAIYCAFDQGKFWQAHDLLMSAKGYTLINDEVKNDISKSQVIADFLASTVNKNELKKCLDSGKYDARLAQDSALASTLGISGTPGFYLNTTVFAGAYSWTDMKSVADAALK